VTIDFVSIPYDGSDAKYVSTFAGRRNARISGPGRCLTLPESWVADPAPADVAALWIKRSSQYQGLLKYKGEYYGFPSRPTWHDALLQHGHVHGSGSRSSSAKTMDDLLSYAQKLTQTDSNGESRGCFAVRYHGNAKGIADKWLPFLHAFGGQLYAPDIHADVYQQPESIASCSSMVTW